MRNVFISSLIAMLSGVGMAAPCRNVDGNSCMHLLNKASEPVKVNCDGYGQFVENLNLNAGEETSIQFDRSWADGLGYFGYDVSLKCVTQFVNSGDAVTVDFKTFFYGDRFRLSVTDQDVSVLVREFWSNHRSDTFVSQR